MNFTHITHVQHQQTAASACPLLWHFTLALLLLPMFFVRSFPQSVQIGDTNAALVSIQSEGGEIVKSEWGLLDDNKKTRKLIEWAADKLGAPVTPNLSRGFTTTGVVRYTRNNSPVSVDMTVRQTIIPLRVSSPRYPDASAAIMLNRYTSAPGLAYPRLLIRYATNNTGWMVEEYAYHWRLGIDQMKAKFGDCVFRSSLKILEQRNKPAFNSLMRTLESRPKESVARSLKRVYDVRSTPIGQGELALFSEILVDTNLEEEFENAYISGTIDQSFKPIRGDSRELALAKELAKEIMQGLVGSLGGELVGWFKALWDFLTEIF